MTENSNRSTITIEELVGRTFIVQDYQRGYKWTAREVLDLLEDITAYDKKEDAFYCLQPLALVELGNNEYEVIDGQQRLSTIFIILSILKEPIYTISYNTRKSSELFLKKIGDLSCTQEVSLLPTSDNLKDFENRIADLWQQYTKDVPLDENGNKIDNTDNYHFFAAYKTASSWLNNRENSAELLKNFAAKLLKDTRFIWYIEPKETKAKIVFRNLNDGKIALTNAELIKAEFINRQKNNNIEVQGLKQNELASEWDMIERELHNDQFWFFINNDTNSEHYETRIDYLFELLVEAPKKGQHDSFYTYRKIIQCKDDSIPVFDWTDLKLLFFQLHEWYEDNELYHLIGYLVCHEIKKTKDIIEFSKNFGKAKFRDELIKEIRKDLKKLFEGKDESEDYLSLLDYHETYDWMKKTLLLYNLEIYQSSNANYRFPFDKFKQHNWSLEHIHAQNTEEMTTVTEILDWHKDIKKLCDDFQNKSKDKSQGRLQEEAEDESDLKFPEEKFKRISTLLQEDVDKSSEIPDHWKNSLSAIQDDLSDFFKMHSIANMALLDGATNSSFNNKHFVEKRELLIAIDKKAWDKPAGGKKPFIPIGTKNVFLKYTSSGVDQMTIWGWQDREDYLSHLQDTLEKYIPQSGGEDE